MNVKPEIELIVQYRHDSRPKRRKEYEYCLLRNLNNPWIRAVHCLVDDDARVPACIASHPKYVEKHIGHWLKFSDAFDYAAHGFLDKASIGCLSNLDIFLDDCGTNWSQARGPLESKAIFCLSRHDYDPESGKVTIDAAFQEIACGQTQDAWFFRPPVTIHDCDFEIGMLACDNAIAARIKLSGYVPVNAMFRFKIFHVDICRGKNSQNQVAVHDDDIIHDRRPPNRHPERVAQFMVPDIDSVKSIDAMLDIFQLSEMIRYQIACELLSRFVKIRNT